MLTLLAAADTSAHLTGDELLTRLRSLSSAFLVCGDARRVTEDACALLERHRVPLLTWGEQSHPPAADRGPECLPGGRRPMSMWKNAAVRCLLLVTELLIVFLTADILWQLLCSRPPFSLPVFLLSGGLMTAGNALFRRRPRLFWQVLALNLLLCALWIPLLSATLDLTYPPLLVIQVPLYLFPLCRGIHWGTAPAALRQVRSAGEYMALYALFYLIVASFATQLLFRVPAVLAVLAADLLAAVAMRTAGRNTIRAGAPSLSRLPALLLPAALFCAAAGICAALLALRGELIPLVRAAGAILQQGLQAVVQLLLSLFAGRSSTAGETLAAGGGGSASTGALPETDAGPGIDPQLLAALLGLALAALLILAAAALIRWLWRNRRRVLSSGEDGGAEDLTRTSLRRPGPLQRLRRWLRLRSFLLRRAGHAPGRAAAAGAVGRPPPLHPAEPGDAPGVSGPAGSRSPGGTAESGAMPDLPAAGGGRGPGPLWRTSRPPHPGAGPGPAGRHPAGPFRPAARLTLKASAPERRLRGRCCLYKRSTSSART